MKLLHVAIEGVGRFGTTARLDGLGPGINILSAQNEAGKSTMFRAIRTCLFERHDTKRDEVRRLATEGLSLPVKVAIRFEHDGDDYELSKSFLRSPAARLTRNGTEIARNRDADEKLWEILGITPDNRIDQGAFGVLWVEQGQSFYVPQPSEAAASILNNVIQQEVGTLVGGERARQLVKEVKDEIGKLLTDGGKPKAKGPIDVAQRHHEAIEGQRLDAEQRLRELDSNLERLASLRAEFTRLGDPVETQRLTTELQNASNALQNAEASEQALKQLANEESRNLQLVTAQREALDLIKLRARTIDENRSRLKQLSAEHDSMSEAISRLETDLAQALSRKAALEQDIDANDAEDRKLQRLMILDQKTAERNTMQTRLKVLQAFELRLNENERALKSITVDEQAIADLADIERNIETVNLRLDSSAARLTIELRSAASVTLNGAALKAGISRLVTEPLVVSVDDLATITLSPPAASLASVDSAMREQQARLQALLARYAVSSAADLRLTRAERSALEDDARILKAERLALALKDSPASEIMRLQVAIQQVDGETKKVLTEIGADRLPARAAMEQRRQALFEARGMMKAEAAEVSGAISVLTENQSREGKVHATLIGQSRELQQRLEADLALLPDDTRQVRLDEAVIELERRSSSHRAIAALLAEKGLNAPSPDEVENMRLRAGRLKRAFENRIKEIADLRERIAVLTGQVQTAGGDGLGERVAELQAESVMALADVERQTERASVLQLLRNVVETAYEKRREQLNAPLRRHLKPFLQDVFPQAEIALGDAFTIEGLKRKGQESEIFGRLSSGTQEQVAVLVRLAMGAMIAEKGHDVPIILDDALVFSDDARIEQMFDAINRAARNQQVIVLTCRARSFASLGGNQLRIS